MLVVSRWQRDRAAWLMRPKDCFVDTVAENLLDRLEVIMRIFIIYLVSMFFSVTEGLDDFYT
jgi:hypothetical protein